MSLFGEAFGFIIYNDCDGNEIGGSYPNCDQISLKGYPSWVLFKEELTTEGKKIVEKVENGAKSLKDLSKIANCDIEIN